ncbi:hypothetical protein O181_021813 [Austropuccinia psidii MF-1]|uniref:Uncharacterized protein n=1 Tax=Austropuccinia psidii MF-1 TaxID=1389203 RepID=A0A9Q3CFL5_9BASI|nr:hypothetical protein [Austropuccinia psidii MF-1]
MSTPCYSSICICICKPCSYKTHLSPEGDRKGTAFTPFHYKQHIEQLKSDIEPKNIPKVPTSALGSECLQASLDQNFPKNYYQLTQSTFSTTQGLNSTAQKPYSRSNNLLPQDLGLIVSEILFLRYNISPGLHTLSPPP